MASGYVIAHYRTDDADMYRQYQQAAAQTLGGHDVEVLVAHHETEAVEGEVPGETTILMKFPSKEAAQAWYDSPEYQEIINLRIDSTKGFLTIVPGFEMPGG